METFLEQLFNGVSLGSILLLVALGLTFTFGQMGVINMAHGEFIMAGAYTPYMLQTSSIGLFAGATGAGLAFVAALPLAFLLAGVMGVILERVLLRRMYGRPLDTLLVIFGVSLILQQGAKDLFGAPNVNVRAPTWLTGNWSASPIQKLPGLRRIEPPAFHVLLTKEQHLVSVDFEVVLEPLRLVAFG